ncbi:MAG: hypothetical protein ABR559_00830 [Gemmatimonadota bacterium]
MQARWHLSGGGLALLNILLTAGTVLAQGPPTNVAAVAQAATTVNITWTGATGPVGYHVQRGPTATGAWTRITATRLSATATSHTDAAAPAGTNVCYRVQAIYNSGNQNSSGICVTTPAATTGGGGAQTIAVFRPGVIAQRAGISVRNTALLTVAPEIIKTEVVNNFVGTAAVGSCLNVEWQAVPNATAYRLQRTPPQMGSFSITPAGFQGTSFRDCSVPGNLDVTYAVFATVAGSADEIGSSPHTVKTPNTLGIIMGIAVKYAEGALTATWVRNPGASSYEIRSPAFATQETAGTPVPNDTLRLTHVFRPTLPKGWTNVYLIPIFDLGSGRLPGQTYTLSVWVP